LPIECRNAADRSKGTARRDGDSDGGADGDGDGDEAHPRGGRLYTGGMAGTT
jgi:hypothetical protein